MVSYEAWDTSEQVQETSLEATLSGASLEMQATANYYVESEMQFKLKIYFDGGQVYFYPSILTLISVCTVSSTTISFGAEPAS